MAETDEFEDIMECGKRILWEEDFEKYTDVYDAYDWRIKCKNITEALIEARNKSRFVDVLFFVGQRFFRAHKIVLACGSPVFEAMFFGHLAEKQKVITLPDDDPGAFEIMLQFLYGECIEFPSILVACKSYSMGDKYLLTELMTKSADFIKAFPINDETFWGVVEANLCTNKYIVEKFRQYIELNTAKLVKSEKFLHAPRKIINFFLKWETLNLSEYELLVSVSKWCLKKFSKDTMEKTKDFLQHIRFSVLTPKEFCLFTEKFPEILDTPTSLKIVKHLIDKPIYNLPDWCSTKTEKRKCIKRVATPLKSSSPARLPFSPRLTLRKGKILFNT